MAAKLAGASIVIVGDFNPPIFTPDWLQRQNLIGPDDAALAVSKSENTSNNFVVSRQITKYSISSFALQVLEGQLSIGSEGPVTPALKDLAVGILTVLPHIPVKAVGLNFYAHYEVLDKQVYHRIGDALAPKDLWMKALGVERDYLGLADLTVSLSPVHRTEAKTQGDERRFTVQPSAKYPATVFFQLNDHRVVPSELQTTGSAAFVAKLLATDWDASHASSYGYFEALINAASAQ